MHEVLEPVRTEGQATPPVAEVPQLTVYPVSGSPPVEAGAVQVTVTYSLPVTWSVVATDLTPVGVPGVAGAVVNVPVTAVALHPTMLQEVIV